MCLLEVVVIGGGGEGGGELLDCLLPLPPLLVEVRFLVLDEPETGERGGEKYLVQCLDRGCSSSSLAPPPSTLSSPSLCDRDFGDSMEDHWARLLVCLAGEIGREELRRTGESKRLCGDCRFLVGSE